MNEDNQTEKLLSRLRSWPVEKIQQFVEAIGGINHQNTNGYTLLHLAAEHSGNIELVELFISMGADVNLKQNYGMAPLHLAAFNRNIDVLGSLLSHKANINIKDDKHGYTPLGAAVTVKDFAVVKYLVSHGADVNIGGKCEYTPLHIAAMNGDLKIAKYLLSNGADANSKSNNIGKYQSLIPLDIAKEEGHTELVQYLSSIISISSEPGLDKGFMDVLKKIIDKYGKGTMLDTDKCRAYVGDYSKRDYMNERALLLKAVEAGVSREMIIPADRIVCMKQQRRKLQEDSAFSPTESLYVIDVLAEILWGITYHIE